MQRRDGLRRVMETLGMFIPALPTLNQPLRHWTREAFVEAGQEGLRYPDSEVGADVLKGITLGRMVEHLDNLLFTPVAPAIGGVM